MCSGIKELRHRETENYYLCCLGRETPPVARRALINDSSLLDAIADRPTKRVRTVRSAMHGGFHDEPVLALEDDPDREEGEPEELGDIATKTSEVMKSVVDKSQGHF